MKIVKPGARGVDEICQALSSGEVVIFPTDTVYGFLADAQNKKAVAKIYKIKKRPKSKPLPLFVTNLKTAKGLAEINSHQEKILKKYWPGKYTFILRRKKEIKLFGVDKKTVALRIPKHTLLKKVLRKFGGPLAQTSVNASGENPLKNLAEIEKVFGKNKLISLALDGKIIKKSKSSKVIDITENRKNIIRK